jgi:hypothetical protein
MKYEIEIELPENLRDKWRPVAFRDAQVGEYIFWLGGEVRRVTCTAASCLIVEPIDSRDEIKKWWPKTLGFDWIARDKLGVWGWFGGKPYLLDYGFCNKENETVSFSVAFELFDIDAPGLANTADQVWANPWKEQQ